MKYVATINGKKYEVEVEKLEAYKSLDRNGVAAPAAPVSEPEDLTDDLELVAVITAAIAAASETESADGLVVRSIIRR